MITRPRIGSEFVGLAPQTEHFRELDIVPQCIVLFSLNICWPNYRKLYTLAERMLLKFMEVVN